MAEVNLVNQQEGEKEVLAVLGHYNLQVKEVVVIVLQLLELSILEGSIRTSQERMGGGLIKAARQGTLDTSRLEKHRQAETRKQEAAQAEVTKQTREALQERAHLERLTKMANIPLSTLLGGAQ